MSSYDELFDSLTVEEQDDDIYVVKHEGATAQVGWNEEENEGAPELGGYWIFSADWSDTDEEWKDIRRENRDEAIDRLKQRVADTFGSNQWLIRRLQNRVDQPKVVEEPLRRPGVEGEFGRCAFL